ncbi:MAG: aldehyde ferredoxin oxidoreductase family protein [Sulfolobales archaeon]
MPGFWGRLLDIDLSSQRHKIYEIPGLIYRMFIGGRGLATWILWRELGDKWEDIDPLGPENILLVLTGPLTGYYPGGVKVIISGKSPQSNGVVGSAVSTELSIHLKAAGYDGLIIRGVSKDPVYLYIDDEKIEYRDASRIWGKDAIETLKYLREDTKIDFRREGAKPWPPSIYIGPAGENLVRTASVNAKWTHGAGYGGYGAVFGSKKLKAIVVRGRGPLPEVSDSEKFLSLRKEIISLIMKDYHMKHWGTPLGIYYTGATTSSEPIRNWQEEWHNVREFSHWELETKYWVRRYWSDYSCPLSCMKVSYVEDNGEIYLTDGPDYEMAAYLGSNLGIFDIKSVIKLSAEADRLGLCGIQTGNVMGFAFELFEKGIITKDDLGYELRWGDYECAKKLMNDITYRRGFGKILAEGTYRAALQIAKLKGLDPSEVLKYAVQSKGIGIGAHGIRSKADYPQPIAYVASVQGGDHTSVAGLPINTQESETWKVFLDSAVICMFTGFNVPEEKILDILNAVTGWRVSKEELYREIGPRILSIQRILLLLGGPDIYWDPRVHDENPKKFYEPLPSGPFKGWRADPEEVRKLKIQYFNELGWDEYGIPREETLNKLGIGYVSSAVKKIKKRLGLE